MFLQQLGLYTRHPTAADIPAIVAFANQCAQMDMGIAQVNTAEQLLAFWQDPNLHPERDILLVLDGRENIVASLTALITPPYTHVYQEVNIHPIYRGRGLEAFLLERAETHALSAQAYLDEAHPITIVHGVYSRQNWLRALLDTNGYAVAQTVTRLSMALDGPLPIPTLPDGVIIRPYADDQAAALSAAIREINQDIGAARPPSFEALLLHPSFDPSLVVAAWQGNAVAGVAILFAHAEDDPHSGQLAYVGVRRAWRGDDLGRSVAQIGLRIFQAAGIGGAMVFATRPSIVSYYQYLGFSTMRETLVYQKILD